MTTAGVVGSERPGLKPRAQSASPLKGAVRRPGARVDRPDAGAVGISRLQPAWGLSPAVNGRAIVERAARLVCAACRAGRVGHVESPRRAARAGEAAPRPYRGTAMQSRSGTWAPRWGDLPALVGVRRCLTRRPAGPATHANRCRGAVMTTEGVVGHGALPRRAARRGRQRLAPTGVRRCIRGRTHGHHGWVHLPPCRDRAVPDWPPPRNRRDPSCVKHNGCSPSGDCRRGIAPGGLDGLARTLVDCARCRTGRRTRPVPGRS